MHDFSFRIFCLIVPKNFVWANTSVYQKISGSEKFYASERGEGVSRFSVENFLSQCRKFPWGESFSVSLISGIEKFYASEGRVMSRFSIFCRIFFCITVPKNLVGEPFCAVFQKISGSEKVYG